MDTHAIQEGRPLSLCRFCNNHHGILVASGLDNHLEILDTMEFVQEPSKDDLFYWSLLNPTPLEKPALAPRPTQTSSRPKPKSGWTGSNNEGKTMKPKKIASSGVLVARVSTTKTACYTARGTNQASRRGPREISRLDRQRGRSCSKFLSFAGCAWSCG